MSAIALPNPPLSAGRRRRGLVFLVREFVAAICDGLELASRYRMLAYKTDSELASLGLKREDIPQAVMRLRRG
jgi:hypothetical protein